MVRRFEFELETPEERLERKVHSAFPEPPETLRLDGQPYECTECKRSFLCDSSVERHLWHHLRCEVGMWPEPTPRGQQYQCGECGLKFRLRDTMLSHMRVHLSFPCTKSCRLVYPNKAALTQHALVRHSRRRLHDWYRDELAARIWKVPEREGNGGK